MSPSGDLRIPALEARFRELTLLMYDTGVPIPVLRERVFPYLSPDIEFVDPWLVARGRERFEAGLPGFHCAFRFDFDIAQIGVALDARGEGGRAMVDGTMNLRSIPSYTYPLRTILVYDFALGRGARGLLIDRQEEMWSFGDMLAHAPFPVGWLYRDVFRPASGRFFTAFFRLSCALSAGRVRPSRPASRPCVDLPG